MDFRDKKFLENLINRYSKNNLSRNIKYHLIENAFSTVDILKGIEVLLSGQLTMSEITQKFECEFAKYIGAKYALMVNSGSSANLIAAFALINPRKRNNLKKEQKMIPKRRWLSIVVSNCYNLGNW